MPLLVEPKPRTWARMLLATLALSVFLYVVFVLAIGEPTGSVGPNGHGPWQTGRRVYGPVLAVVAATLAVVSPEAALLTAPLLAISQVGLCVAGGIAYEIWTGAYSVPGRGGDPVLCVLVTPFIAMAVVPWVAGGAAAGAILRLGLRAARRRTDQR